MTTGKVVAIVLLTMVGLSVAGAILSAVGAITLAPGTRTVT